MIKFLDLLADFLYTSVQDLESLYSADTIVVQDGVLLFFYSPAPVGKDSPFV